MHTRQACTDAVLCNTNTKEQNTDVLKKKKKLNIKPPTIPAIPCLGMHSEESNAGYQTAVGTTLMLMTQCSQ